MIEIMIEMIEIISGLNMIEIISGLNMIEIISGLNERFLSMYLTLIIVIETDLINTGMEKIISDPTVNVGKKKIQEFERSFPGGYQNILSRITIKMDAAEKVLKQE